jgi:hypothetical protein
MRPMTRRELVGRSIASGLVPCERSKTRRPRDSSTVTVRYIVNPERALGPADTPAQFLVFMPLVAWNRGGVGRAIGGEMEAFTRLPHLDNPFAPKGPLARLPVTAHNRQQPVDP